MKALIVDDSRAMRAIIGQILRGIGFDVVEAGEGREALDRLAAGDVPGLALVDWNMPGMDGLELVRAVRGRPEYDEMKVMMVTTESEAGRMSEAIAAGADEYVMKPFTRDVILLKLEGLRLQLA